MLFDIGWPELMLIGAVALVVIGPKDLPRAMRVAGYWMRKARSLSREFHSSVEQMIREAELDEMRQQLKKATEFDIEKEFHNTVDPTGSLAESIKPPDIPDFFEEKPAVSTAAQPAQEDPEAAEHAAPVAIEHLAEASETQIELPLGEPAPVHQPARVHENVPAHESMPAAMHESVPPKP